MNDQVKVFIVDDSEPTLFMLNLWLDHMDDIEIVGTALVTDEFKGRVLESEADVIICNWHMTGRGYAQLQELKRESLSCPYFHTGRQLSSPRRCSQPDSRDAHSHHCHR